MRMFSVWPLSRRPLIACTLLVFVIPGCHQKPTTTALPTGNRTTATVAFSAAHVQSLPLYHQAQQACSRKQYRQAADLLARLAEDSRLSTQERDFCQEQRAICLRDAGLPVPPFRSAFVAPVPVNARPLTPDQANCGPRALRLVCERLGVRAFLPDLQRTAGTTAQGTSLQGLAQAAQAVGLKAEGVQVSREALSHVEMPAIAWVNENHYVAVLATQGEGAQATAVVHDPNANAEQILSQEQLLSQCSGYLLLVHR